MTENTLRICRHIPDQDTMLVLGESLAKACEPGGAWIYLVGELGAGKTTWVRGFMRGLGYRERVKSPTYTLVEPYLVHPAPGREVPVYHFDFYRISTPEALFSLGMEEYFSPDVYCLVEWPQHAAAVLPTPDIVLCIQSTESNAGVIHGREVMLEARTARGEAIVERFSHV